MGWYSGGLQRGLRRREGGPQTSAGNRLADAASSSLTWSAIETEGLVAGILPWIESPEVTASG